MTALQNEVETFAQNFPSAEPQKLKAEVLSPKKLRIFNDVAPLFEILISWNDDNNAVDTQLTPQNSRNSSLVSYFFTHAGFEHAGKPYIPEGIAIQILSDIEKLLS